MDWKEYEEITKHIYETLGKQSGVEIVCYGNTCKVKGNSSIEHQIDVLTQHSDGLHIYKTAIECKYWNETVNKDTVMKVIEIIRDASINKGVIVSKRGFTPDAITYAQFHNIGLVELREMTDKDWENRLRNIVVNFETKLPKITDINFETSSTIGLEQNNLGFLQVKKITGEIIEFMTYANDFHAELYNKIENENFEKIYFLDSDSVVIDKLSGKEIPVSKLQFRGVLKIARNKLKIKGEDHIWLIMNSIFENKTHIISKDRQIRERED